MPSKNRASEQTARIDREAAAWVVRRSQGLTEEEQLEFERWIGADATHRARLEAQERTWADLAFLEVDRAGDGSEPDPDLLAPTKSAFRGIRPLWAASVLAAAASLGLGIFIWQALVPPDAIHRQAETANTDAIQPLRLRDGSLVQLNIGSKLETQFTSETRIVRLLSGEAHFDVAKDPQRPFVVRAGDAEIRAVGTAFNVQLNGDEVGVLVTEGIVQLTPASAGNSESPRRPTRKLEVRQRALAPSSSTSESKPIVIETLSDETISELLAWKSMRLEFASTPLSQVIEAFNRRNRLQFELGDEELGKLSIDGTFRSDNQEGLIRMLGLLADIETDRSQEGKIVFQKAAGP